MCWCRPEIRTPFCGRPECRQPAHGYAAVPTVGTLPPAPVTVIEHARPDAAMLRFWAQMAEESFFGLRSPQCATELRAAAARLESTDKALLELRAFLEDNRGRTFTVDGVTYTPYRGVLREFYRLWPDLLDGRSSWSDPMPAQPEAAPEE